MNRYRWSMAILLAVPCAALAQTAKPYSLEGLWSGAVIRDGAIQALAVHLSTGPDGLKGTFDLPDLGLFEEPLAELSYKHPTLRFKILYGSFDSVVHDDVGEITGVNKKWGPPVRLHLKRTPRSRPPFRKDEVRFKSGALQLSGTLLLPASSGPHPAVVFIHGSAQPGRDDWTYRRRAYALVRDGVACMLYDKRPDAAFPGDATARFDTLADDALAAVQYLRTRDEIDAAAIGLFGSSQGGWIAPLAATRSESVAFVITHAGPAVSVWDQEMHRVEYTMRAEGFKEDDVRAAVELTRSIFSFVESGDGWDRLSTRLAKAKNKKWASIVGIPESPQDALAWREEAFDPTATLKKLTCPILAMFGENDVVVPPKENVEKLKRYLKEAGNQDVTVKVFSDVGHGMELSSTLKNGLWKWPKSYWVWPKIAPGYFETILSWIGDRVDRPGQAAGQSRVSRAEHGRGIH